MYTQHIVLMNTHTLLLCIAPQITVLGMTGLLAWNRVVHGTGFHGTGLSTRPGFMENRGLSTEPTGRPPAGFHGTGFHGTELSTEPGFRGVHILFGHRGARTPRETRLPGAQPGSVIKEGRNPVAPALKLRGLEPGL